MAVEVTRRAGVAIGRRQPAGGAQRPQRRDERRASARGAGAGGRCRCAGRRAHGSRRQGLRGRRRHRRMKDLTPEQARRFSWLGAAVCAPPSRARPNRGSPPSTASPSAAAASWPWPATSGSPRRTPSSASRRSTSASRPASAARSGCRGRWAWAGPSTSCLSGRSIRADEALRIGLVQAVFPRDDAHGPGDEAGRRAGRQEPAGDALLQVGRALLARRGHRHRAGDRARPVRALLRQRGPERGHGGLPEKRKPEFKGR